MDLFVAQTAVTLTVPLQDGHGNDLTVSAIEWRLLDQDGLECLPRQPLAGFIGNAPVATLVVPAACNDLPDGMTHGLRAMELYCTVGSNMVLLQAAYGLESAEPLIVGGNSFQSWPTAQWTALAIPNLPGWLAATRVQQVTALIEAWRQIRQVPLMIGAQYVELDGLSSQQFAALPMPFANALRLAQVVQADANLGGDAVEQRRRDGVMAEAVGESRQAYRKGTPLSLPVSRRALGYLAGYVTYSKRIGRSA